MTLPRELSIRDGRLIQNPVRELANYHGKRVAYENVPVSGEINLSGVEGRLLDMTVNVRPADEAGYEWFKVKVARDGSHSATIRFKPKCNIVRINRTGSGDGYDIVHIRNFLVCPNHGCIKLRIIMDYHSVELFVNDGEQAATFQLYSPVTADAVSFESYGAVMMDVEKYGLIFEEES